MAPLLASTSVFDKGALKVKDPPTSVKVQTSRGRTEVYIVEPDVAGTYPVIFFCHGWLLDPSRYSKLLNHISSHGYIVVAPQFYGFFSQISEEKEIKMADEIITDWLPTGLAPVLGKAKPDISELAVAGHSRGGKVAFGLALRCYNTLKSFKMIKALVGIDPVDGTSPYSSNDPEILKYVPRTLPLEIPVGIIGTGLGDQGVFIFPACSPRGVNHAEFFNECKHPPQYFLAKEYGHCDMLDNPIPLVKTGKGSKDPMRRASGGIVVALLNAYLQDEPHDLDVIVEYPSIAPILLDPVISVKECDESSSLVLHETT